MIINGLLVYFSSRSSLQKLSIERLTSLRESKKQQIEDYFSLLRKLIITYSEDQVISSALTDFSSTADTSGNPEMIYRSYFQNISKRFNIDDILLLNSENNNVVFSLNKIKEYGIILNSINRGYSGENNVSISDFKYYHFADNKPYAFLSAPIIKDGKPIGVLIFRISIDYINQIMTNNENWEVFGLGKTVETYLVGSDYKMRNNSRFFIQDTSNYLRQLKKVGVSNSILSDIEKNNSSILAQEVRTEASFEALKGYSGTKIINDYRGIQVLSSYMPLAIPGLNWVVLAEIDTKEAFAPLTSLQENLVMIGLFILLLGGIIAVFISQSVIKPVVTLTDTVKRFSKGDLTEKAKVYADDELGLLASTFNNMADEIMRQTTMLKTELVEREKIETELKLSREKLRSLSTYLQSAREDERKMIAREIHDELGQSLNTLKLKLSMLKDYIPEKDTQPLIKISDINDLIDNVIRVVKKLITELRPQLLDDLGLSAAIEWYVTEFEKNSGIKCFIFFENEEFNFKPEMNISIFRIIQESLTNAAKHSRATKVDIGYYETNESYIFSIIDNGIGIKPVDLTRPHSFGIIGMKERIKYWKGDITFTGKETGTTITVSIPKQGGVYE
ncbi:MAG: histidine kinase [Ignavibacteriaceae bacterium]|nr:histidine kinase [Ignavibacteriaceae bacterium]